MSEKVIKDNEEINIVDCNTLDEAEMIWRTKYMNSDWKIKKPLHVYSGFMGLGSIRYRMILIKKEGE